MTSLSRLYCVAPCVTEENRSFIEWKIPEVDPPSPLHPPTNPETLKAHCPPQTDAFNSGKPTVQQPIAANCLFLQVNSLSVNILADAD